MSLFPLLHVTAAMATIGIFELKELNKDSHLHSLVLRLFQGRELFDQMTGMARLKEMLLLKEEKESKRREIELKMFERLNEEEFHGN